MANRWKRTRRDIEDFIVDDDSDDAFDNTANEPWSPDTSSTGPRGLRSRHQIQQASLESNSNRDRAAYPEGLPLRVADSDALYEEDPESDPELLPAIDSALHSDSDAVAMPSSDPLSDTEQNAASEYIRGVREAAIRAATPIRRQARVDLGYISDLAEAYDSDDSDELDADGIEQEPLATQSQDKEEDHDLADVPEECEDVGILDASSGGDEARFALLASQIERDGLFLLVDEVRKAENDNGSKLGQYFSGAGQEYWTDLSMLTLCSMPEKLIHELASGNLKQAYDSDAELRETLDGFEERAKKHPCIYARSLTTADGQLMTTDQARRLVKWLRRYVSDDEAIQEHPKCQEAFHRIDAEFGSKWKRVSPKAPRAYLATRSSNKLDCRVENVRMFCHMLVKRCQTCEDEEKPLKPLLYIGYAARADRRKRQHEACGSSANWLATLVQATCNVLWGRDKFKMHFMVVCLLGEKRQGIIAEMLLTRITGAYYHVGGGFCIDMAGKSMESLHFRELTTKQNLELWNTFGEWVDQNTPYNANAERQLARHRALIARRSQEANDQHRQEMRETLEKMRENNTLCQKYKDHEAFQDEEGKELVRKMTEIYQEASEILHDPRLE